jgi:nucleoside-diphosphate-sugar epimerase
MKILVTGATGFLGKRLSLALTQKGYSVLGSVRQPHVAEAAVQVVTIGQLGAETDWQQAVVNCDVVIHTAARVHIQNSQNLPADRQLFQLINVDGTLNLARQAAAYGVKRFIFLSTIKVNGERTALGHPFRATDVPNPQDPYGLSKLDAEVGLREIAQKTGMEVVIIRPPLIYGRGVKGNFQTLLRLVSQRVPLPFGCITLNRRSFVGLDNLISLITVCLSHPGAANQTFLVSDNEDVSTAELLTRLGKAVNRSPVLLPVSLNCLKWLMKLLRKPEAFEKIAGTLQVDISATCERLGWQPSVSLNEGLAMIACEAPNEKAV